MKGVTPSPVQVTLHKPPTGCGRVWTWLKDVCWKIGNVPRAVINTVRIIKQKELLAPFKKAVIPGRAITAFPTIDGSINHLVGDSELMKALSSSMRSSDGKSTIGDRFSLFQDRDNQKFFVPLLRDLFFQRGFPSEIIREMCLFSAGAKQIKIHHRIFAEYFSRRYQEPSRSCVHLQQLATKIINEIPLQSAVDGQHLANVYATRTLLYELCSETMTQYDNISSWIEQVISYTEKMVLKMPCTKEERQSYSTHISSLRECIRTIIQRGSQQKNSLVGEIQSRIADSREQECLVFMALVAGVQTSALFLNYLLWELGRNSMLQEQIRGEKNDDKRKELLQHVIFEGLRMCPPAPYIGRQPRQAIDIRMASGKKGVRTYHIRQKEGVLLAPFIAAKDPHLYPQPDRFDSNRDLGTSVEELSWLPFGFGVHMCPGRKFATTESALFLDVLLQNCRFTTVRPTVFSSTAIALQHGPSTRLVFTKI